MATHRKGPSPIVIAAGGSFIAFLDVTITNLALPNLTREFHGATVHSLSWVVTLYAVPFAALLAPAGRIADVLGRRRLFVAGILIFTAASGLAAAAPTLPILLVARAAQGIGAAGLIPASLAIVLADIPAERRPAAVGLWSVGAAAAAAIGPAVGGSLVSAFDWRALFCINLPSGLWLAYRARTLPRQPLTHEGVPDVLGTILLGAGIAALVLGITEGPDWGWREPTTLACIAGAVLAIVVALLRSTRHAAPAVPVDLWRIAPFRAANLVSVLFGAALYTWLLLSVLFLVEVWRYSELSAGLAMTVGGVFAATVGIVVGRSHHQFSPRGLTVGGGVLMGATTGALALWLPAGPHFLTVWMPISLTGGLGIGAVSVGVSSVATLSVPPPRFAVATGLTMAARQIGGAVGVAVLAVLLDGRLGGTAPFRHVYGFAAGCSALAAIVALVGMRRPAPADDLVDLDELEPAAAPAPASAPAPAKALAPAQALASAKAPALVKAPVSGNGSAPADVPALPRRPVAKVPVTVPLADPLPSLEPELPAVARTARPQP